MLRAALLFLVFALVAALLGFTGLAGTAVDIAQLLAFVFLVLFLVSVIFGAVQGRGAPPV